MSVKANKAVVKRWNEDIVSSGDVNAFGEVLAENCTAYGGSDIPWAPQMRGLEQVKEGFGGMLQQYPSLKASVEAMIGEGDFVAARLIHTSEGKPILAGIALYRLVDGKIVEDWYASNEINP